MSTERAREGLYSRVQQFHAEQMQALDSGRFEEYAETFTEDGEFRHSPGRSPARTRAGIAEELTAFHQERFAGEAVQRRHWFNMLNVQEQADGTVHATFYVLALLTRPGERVPEIAPSCLVRDVLVEEDGRLLTRSRRVEHDHVPEA
ncbi:MULTISPECIES: nuclear transport factor 2 family protein [Streptomyces]|uniref:nuclear transport factor 2 family protein n=1 Tax=Streptomyces TaxID=1883 RepID=UPI00103D5B1A|nr:MULTISPECIES: nuclear transport factor 2 family protein [Streptomyces]MBT3072492.1 nuclear transport factor 2 family protein [Streptomyces sp. COG21]MBT3080895.1 nuclear transport factor 2 family protein [Streptomyces sp. COG20]MBT3086749.1 nuclear transport factor 2 family protein [Streptomyces sp. CYG21]MBT3099904.1 nuclear transport factor 2 family protein [Streptomyces sp. CBG30]MBT3102484.1 nuclear transport factor 2 family protein [Streptomyces sp. COG19]